MPNMDNEFYGGMRNYETWGALLWLDTEPVRRGDWEHETRSLHAHALNDPEVNFEWQMVRDVCVMALADKLQQHALTATCPGQLSDSEMSQAIGNVDWVALAQVFVDRFLPLECGQPSHIDAFTDDPEPVDPFFLPDDDR